jgi:ABC-type nitrate/sulfonate/bicarbonate transport system permease component
MEASGAVGTGSAPAVGASLTARLASRSATVVAVLAWIGIWWALAELEAVPYLPNPAETLDRMRADASLLWHDTLTTMGRAYAGFVIGSVLGIAIPLLLGLARPTRLILGPIVEISRTVPGITLLPLFLLWFGAGDMTAILLVTAGSALVMVVSAAQAFGNVPEVLTWAGQGLGAGRLRLLTRVSLPYVVPRILGGLRVTLAASVPWAIAGEFLGAQSGLGFYLWHALPYTEVDRMVCVVVLATLVVVLGDAVLSVVTRRLTRWTDREAVGA